MGSTLKNKAMSQGSMLLLKNNIVIITVVSIKQHIKVIDSRKSESQSKLFSSEM
jgi:hypothetical protein